jgi:hypothetical protein
MKRWTLRNGERSETFAKSRSRFKKERITVVKKTIYRIFGVNIHRKIEIFGLHLKFSKINSLGFSFIENVQKTFFVHTGIPRIMYPVQSLKMRFF